MAGNLTSVTDPLGHITKSTYDALNRKTGEFVMSGTSFSISLTRSASTVTATATAHGYATGDVVEIRGAIQPEYNGFFTITVVDANHFTYTITGTPVNPATGTIVVEKALTSGKTAYLFNHAVQITDALGHVTRDAYDSTGRKTSETSPDPDSVGPLAAPTVRYSYDALGNLKTVTDGMGNLTTYGYDSLNRKVTETGADPDGGGPVSAPVTNYEYDAAGNLIRTIDATGKILTDTYDNLNRKTSEFWVTGKSITSIIRSGSTATVTSAAHGYSNGQQIQISGADQTEYDGLFTITVIDANTFTYTISGTPATTATGTMFADSRIAGTSYDYDAASNLTGQTDGLGNRTSYAYDVVNRKTSETHPDPDGGGPLTAPVTNYTYDANSNLITTTDPDGRITQSSYDNLNRQTGSFELDASANLKTISSITRTAGTAKVTTSAAHGYSTGDVVRISGANQPEYNGFFVITVTSTTVFTYSVVGSPATPATAAPGQTLQALKSLQSSREIYDADGRLIVEYDGQNNKTSYSYDSIDRQTGEYVMVGSTKLVGGITRSGTVATVTLNGHGYVVGNIVNITGADQSQYNGAFTITGVTTNTFTYTVSGSPATPATGTMVAEKSVQSILHSGLTATVTLNSHGFSSGNVVQIRNANQSEYNGFFAITVVDANSFTYTMASSPATNATGTIVAENTVQSTRYTYDAASNLKSVTDGSANVSKFGYDNMDRESGEFWMSGTVKNVSSITRSTSTASVTSTAHGYTSGDVVEIRGANQPEYNGFFKITVVDANTFTYIVMGTPSSATGTIVAEKTNQNDSDQFDANSNNIASTDRNGLRRYFVFDKLNRLIEEHWLAAGIAISSVTFSGTTATVTTSSAHGYLSNDYVEISGVDQQPYDGIFQITVVNSTTFTYTMASSPGVNGTGTTKLARKSIRKIATAYDPAGRITGMSDPDSAYAYTYDSAGRLSTTDNNTTPNLPHVVLTNFYNAANRRFGLTSTVNSAADFSNAYNYDTIGRMNNFSQSGTGVAQKRVDILYNNSGQYSKITRSSTTGSITEVTHSDYTYDSAKRLTSLVHKKPAGTALVTYGWTYDNQGRVKTFTNPDGTFTFGYDAASQVTSASGGTLSESYTYDKSGNRTISGYTTGADNRLTSDGTYNYTYDAEGNRIKRTKISDSTYIDYTYDYRNRLTDEVYRTSGGVKTKALHYVYDVNDRRIERQLDANGDGTYESKERYIYDGQDIVLVYNGSNALISRYLQGPDEDQPLAEESAAGVVKWELPDEQGSIRDMGDNAGNLVAGSHVIYNSFGVVTSGTPGRYAYTGREWDSDAGMYYYRARWYDASVGRFISQDPKGFDAGDVNLYRYVGNSSPNGEDPSGLDATQQAMNLVNSSDMDFLLDMPMVGGQSLGEPSMQEMIQANNAQPLLAESLTRMMLQKPSTHWISGVDQYDPGSYKDASGLIQEGAQVYSWVASHLVMRVLTPDTTPAKAFAAGVSSFQPVDLRQHPRANTDSPAQSSTTLKEKLNTAGEVLLAVGVDPVVQPIKGVYTTPSDFLNGKMTEKQAAQQWSDNLFDSWFVIRMLIGEVRGSGTGQSKKIDSGDYSNLPEPRNVGPGKDFTRATKRAVLEQNRGANGGEIISDESGTKLQPGQQSQRGVTPPDNEATIDHKKPKSKGGTNSPSNAQVLSRKENIAKSDK